jgi:hypothetical protein
MIISKKKSALSSWLYIFGWFRILKQSLIFCLTNTMRHSPKIVSILKRALHNLHQCTYIRIYCIITSWWFWPELWGSTTYVIIDNRPFYNALRGWPEMTSFRLCVPGWWRNYYDLRHFIYSRTWGLTVTDCRASLFIFQDFDSPLQEDPGQL